MKKIPRDAGEYIAEEMRTGKYSLEQAIAIGISRARAAQKSTNRRKTTMAAQADKNAAEELKLFIDNDGSLYRQQTTSIFKNLITKVGRGTYDSSKAVTLFMYLVEAGAKKYAKEFGGTWNLMFSVPTRKLVAAAMRDDFEFAAKNGEYDHYLPKKYQKK
jgi:hypothetical protein